MSDFPTNSVVSASLFNRLPGLMFTSHIVSCFFGILIRSEAFRRINMKKPFGIIIGVVLTLVGVAPAGATGGVAISSGGMKITARAKGDCAKTPTTILITDSTTSCTIEVIVTPKKRYVDVSVLVPLSSTSVYFPSWIENEGKVRLSAKGRGVVTVKKTRGDCVVVSGTERVIAQVTNARERSGSFTNAAKSTPITVTYQQREPALGGCFGTLTNN